MDNNIILIGLSHKTASVEIREKFSCLDDDAGILIDKILLLGVKEVVVISTCNRFEIYFVYNDLLEGASIIFKILADYFEIEEHFYNKYFYKEYSIGAVTHLLRVTSSLDSMVVGENEIAGQVKNFYSIANRKGATGYFLNKLFHQAFRTAKKVKTETGISKNPISIAYISIELAKKVFNSLEKKNALMIGAGEMGELILKYLTKENIGNLTIANRTLKRAEKIVLEINRNANVISLDDLYLHLNNADIVISTISPDNYLLDRDTIENVMSNRMDKPLFIIDISVPRNIDPMVANLNNVTLYNIDDLKVVANENLKNRYDEVEVASRIVKYDAEEFIQWYDNFDIKEAISNLFEKYDSIRKQELDKFRRKKMKSFSDDEFLFIDELTRSIMSKTLHDQISMIKKSNAVEPPDDLLNSDFVKKDKRNILY